MQDSIKDKVLFLATIEKLLIVDISEITGVDVDVCMRWVQEEIRSGEYTRRYKNKTEPISSDEVEVEEVEGEPVVLDQYNNIITNGLTDIQREVIDLACNKLMSLRAVSQRTGVPKETIRNWIRNDDEFRYEFDAAMLTIPRDIAPKAFRVLDEMLDSEIPSERLKAANIALQIVGYARPQEINVNVSNDDSTELIRQIAGRVVAKYEQLPENSEEE